MKTLPKDEAYVLWEHYWESMRREWFKLEVLQDYSGGIDNTPSLRAWLAGNRQESIALLRWDPTHTAYGDICRSKHKAGVRLRRIRIVEYPYTEYTLWEFEHYKHINIPNGEQVFIVYSNFTKGLKLPKGDLMIFDDTKAVVASYNTAGGVVSEDFYNEEDNIASFLHLKEQLLAVARPIKETLYN